MHVHVFGNTPSPAVATYCLRRAAREGEAEFGSDVRAFVEKDFYVDDALKSFAAESEAIDVVKRAQEMLQLTPQTAQDHIKQCSCNERIPA